MNIKYPEIQKSRNPEIQKHYYMYFEIQEFIYVIFSKI